jgi:ketosteroid isomerase-like protein
VTESERVARLREAYAAYNSGDLASVVERMDEEIEVRPPATSVEPEPFRGRDALLRYFEPDLFEFQVAEPLEFLEEGDRILVTVHVRAKGRESGIELDDIAFNVWTIEGERAVRFEVFLEREEALTALRR